MKDKIYFASDFHLGTPARVTSAEREKIIVRWMDTIKEDAAAIYLLGDVFDYWFEYKRVVPKGYTLFFGKLKELRNAGIPIVFFTGNHDMWVRDYFQTEFGIEVYRKPQPFVLQGKRFLLGHGDGLGPKDHTYKLIKKVLNNPFFKWCYGLLHPNFGLWLMKKISYKNRENGNNGDPNFYGKEEWITTFAREVLKTEPFDYFVFGHRHLPIVWDFKQDNSQYLNLGDWTYFQTYGVLQDGQLSLKIFELDNVEIHTGAE